MIHCLTNKDHGLHINVLFNSSRKTTKKPFSVYHRMAAAYEHEAAATESEASKAASGVRERKLRQVHKVHRREAIASGFFLFQSFSEHLTPATTTAPLATATNSKVQLREQRGSEDLG